MIAFICSPQSRLGARGDRPLVAWSQSFVGSEREIAPAASPTALAHFDKVLVLNPSDVWVHVRVAPTHLALGRFDEVPAYVERARRLSLLENTQVSFGRNVAGAALPHKGQDDAAYPEFQAAAMSNRPMRRRGR